MGPRFPSLGSVLYDAYIVRLTPRIRCRRVVRPSLMLRIEWRLGLGAGSGLENGPPFI